MTTGVKVCSATGFLLLALCSCGRGGTGADSYNYLTIEYVQAPVEEQAMTPTILVDLPSGFHFRDAKLADGDTVRNEDHTIGQRFFNQMLDDISEYGLGGFIWPDKEITLMIQVFDMATVNEEIDEAENDEDFEHILKEIEDPLTYLYYPVLRGRIVEFGEYSGSVFLTQVEDELKERLIAFYEDGRMIWEPFVCCHIFPYQEALISVASEKYYISVRASVWTLNGVGTEMLDLLIRIAESIRIKE